MTTNDPIESAYAAGRTSTGWIGSRTFGDDLLRGTGNTGSGEDMQMLSRIHGLRNKKSIARPRCISGPFSTTMIPDSLVSKPQHWEIYRLRIGHWEAFALAVG
jgi:hypothetical protein